ncbi:MAG: hypothetical protein Q9M40_12015 [Sulfurimonas sp.]|nr:hypothetical protein [Sulfurimonas sp.]
MKTGSDAKSPVREIYKAFAYEYKGYIILNFSANGFLAQSNPFDGWCTTNSKRRGNTKQVSQSLKQKPQTCCSKWSIS